MNKKIFDWEKAKESNSSAGLELLRKTHDKDISEEEFVSLYKALGLSQHPPSRGRYKYRRLKRDFGFFTSMVK